KTRPFPIVKKVAPYRFPQLPTIQGPVQGKIPVFPPVMSNIEAQLAGCPCPETVPSGIGFDGTGRRPFQAPTGSLSVEIIRSKTIGPPVDRGIATNGNRLATLRGYLCVDRGAKKENHCGFYDVGYHKGLWVWNVQ